MRERFKRLAAAWLAAIMVVMLMVPTAAAVQFTITKQPTADDPSVGVNDETNVSYQWYKKGGAYEITDKDKLFLDYSDNSYDDRFGYWELIECGGATAYFKLNNMNTDDELTVTLQNTDGIAPDHFTPQNIVLSGWWHKKGASGMVAAEFTPNIDYKQFKAVLPGDGNFFIDVSLDSDMSEVGLKLILTRKNGFLPIPDENDATLSKLEGGEEYRCEITWKNDSGEVIATQISDSFISSEEDNDRWNIWPWILLLTRAVRYYDGEDLVHTARAWKENPLEAVYEPEAREGYTFAGWYTDNDFTEKYDFTEPLTLSKRVYAKWDKN